MTVPDDERRAAVEERTAAIESTLARLDREDCEREAKLPGPIDDLLRAAELTDPIPKNPSADWIERALCELVRMLEDNGADPLRRSLARNEAIRRLNDGDIRGAASLVKAAFDAEKGEVGHTGSPLQGKAVAFPPIEPWSEPVDGEELLDELAHTFSRFLALPGHGAEALALWTVFAHAHDAAQMSPRLALVSATMRCGKTRALQLLGALVPRPLHVANLTAASLFRGIETFAPTLLVDEADTFLGEANELRGVLNSGHSRPGAFVLRAVGDDHEPRVFSTWAPLAVAKIGKLPGTLRDRSIVLRMRRRARGEQVESLRADRISGALEPLRRQMARWAADHLAQLRKADSATPAGFDDRAADNWRPLLAIADLAGGDWPARARAAALVLSGAEATSEADEAVAVRLLADIRDSLEAHGVDRIASKELVEALVAIEASPWSDWNKGKPISSRQVADLLRRFEITPRTIRLLDDKTVKGYLRADFADAWVRYFPETPLQSVTPSQPNRNVASRVIPVPSQEESVTDENCPVAQEKPGLLRRDGSKPPGEGKTQLPAPEGVAGTDRDTTEQEPSRPAQSDLLGEPALARPPMEVEDYLRADGKRRRTAPPPAQETSMLVQSDLFGEPAPPRPPVDVEDYLGPGGKPCRKIRMKGRP